MRNMEKGNMNYKLIKIAKDINSIFSKQRTYAFLAGSGVCIHSPSNLPSGNQLSTLLLKEIVPQDELDTIKGFMDYKQVGLYNQGDFLRFEQLMQYISDYIDPDLKVMNFFSEVKRPNSNHLLLADLLLKKEFYILTTNYDNLFENALLKLGINPESIEPKILKEDWEKKIKENSYYIYKLHGSFSHFNTKQDCRKSIQTTLDQISKGKGDSFKLEDWKESIIYPIIKNNDLIIVGYSGIDDFDIIPTLHHIKTNSRLFWIKHKSTVPPDEAIVTTIEISDSKSPQILGRDSLNLFGFIFQESRSYLNIYQIEVDTTDFLLWFHNFMGLENDSLPKLNSDGVITKFSFDEMNVREEQKLFLAGRIYYDRGCGEESKRSFEKALAIAQEKSNKELELDCLDYLGLFNESKTPKESLRFYKEGLKIAEDLKNDLMEIKFLTNIDRVFIHLGKYEKAQQKLNKAKFLATQNNSPIELSTILNSLARIQFDQKNVDKAIKYLEKAFKSDQDLGDRWGIIRTSNHLAI